MANYTRQMTKDVVIHDQTKVYKGYTLFAPQYGNIAWLLGDGESSRGELLSSPIREPAVDRQGTRVP